MNPVFLISDYVWGEKNTIGGTSEFLSTNCEDHSVLKLSYRITRRLDRVLPQHPSLLHPGYIAWKQDGVTDDV